MMRDIASGFAIAAILTIVSPVTQAATPQTTDLTAEFKTAGAAVDQLQVFEIAGIVIIRGRTADPVEARGLGEYAASLGYARVANLIQIVKHEDADIARRAERELSFHRALEGCQFSVSSSRGVVRVAGRVRHEVQKDVAAQVLRSINGVRSVQMDLQKF